MLEFYLWPHGARIALVTAVIAAALLQTVAAALNVSRIIVSRRYILQTACGVAGLSCLFAGLLPLAQIQQASERLLIVPPEYSGLRWAAAIVAAVLNAVTAFAGRERWRLVSAAAALVFLPAVQPFAGRFYPVLFCAALLCWIGCGVWDVVCYYRSAPQTPSSLSVKEAIDRLRTGILFLRPSGYIVLRNQQMQRLMQIMTGAGQRNGNTFYELLRSGRCRPDCHKEDAGEQLVYTLPDGTVWRFTLDGLTLRGKKYFQLSAWDITEPWRTGEELQRENAELIMQRERLRRTLDGLRESCRREEHRRAQLRVHDVLGQKISLLLRTMQQSGDAGEELLSEFADGLPKELFEEPEPPGIRRELEMLRETMAAIGVRIDVTGAPPEVSAAGDVFADICIEAATNAVRHGLADRITVEFAENESEYVLTVADNGCSAQEVAFEGGGIRGMREKLAGLGGTLEIAVAPSFTVTARIPKPEGEKRL